MIFMSIMFIAIFILRIASQLTKVQISILQKILQQPKIILENQVKLFISHKKKELQNSRYSPNKISNGITVKSMIILQSSADKINISDA